MEALVSFLVLSMLLASVTYMVRISMNWTADSLLNAAEIQEIENDVLLGSFDNPAVLDLTNGTADRSGSISFTYSIDKAPGLLISGYATHPIGVAENRGNIIAFCPSAAPPVVPPDDDDD
jgi:hypothetical protein